MTTNSDAFMRAICAEPVDDYPRRVYADWLDERGEGERAEFVRVQIEIAATENYPGERFCERANGLLRTGVRDCHRCEPCRLRRRERELLAARGGEWAAPCGLFYDDILVGSGWTVHLREPIIVTPGTPPHTHGNGCIARFRRGFVAEVACAWTDWQTHAAAIRAATPLERVRLTDGPALGFDMPDASHGGMVHWLADGAGNRIGRRMWVRDDHDPRRDLLAAEYPGIAFELPPADASRTDVVARFNDLLTSLEGAGLTGQ
jgi:uncharacterized protein (TIGR02996 family)